MKFEFKNKMNNRGDVPTAILVIGVFVVCALAIGSFFYSNMLLNNSFKSIEKMEKANIEIEKNPLESYHDEITKTKFSINSDFDFFKEVISFSVDYYGSGISP